MLKWFFDIFFSFVGLCLLSPLLIIIALIVIIDAKGNPVFKQKRVGKNNQNFYLYKFRTMFSDAEQKGQITIGKKDSRITKMGYWLRKYKLDELLQLINVLKGDMSLVGPRPEVRKYVEMYNDEQMKVLRVKPGITDYASIEYANENELLGRAENPIEVYINEVMPAKLKLNLKYINEQSFWTDIKLILKTIKIVQRN